MYNLKLAKSKANNQSSKIGPFEKALDKNRNSYDLKANDNPSSHESLLQQDRKGDQYKTTEAQMERKSSDNPKKITEKNLEREKMGSLYVPAINAFVEELIQDRRKEFTKLQTKKENDWTLESSTQNADLPEWPQIADQHDKRVLPNDIDREPNGEALLGGKILKASVNDAVLAIKSGETNKYDKEIVEILKVAHDQSRDLTKQEKHYINELKKIRTSMFLKEV
jgi:hypothetical protein